MQVIEGVAGRASALDAVASVSLWVVAGMPFALGLHLFGDAILVGLYAVSTIMVLIFGRETYYVANAPVAKSPTFVESLTGKGGALAIQRPSLSVTVKELILYIFRLPLLLVGELFSKFLFLFRRWKGRWGIDRNTDQDQVSQQW